MNRRIATYGIVASLVLVVIAFGVWIRLPQAQIAKAAGRAPNFIYLPLVMKNYGCGNSLINDGGFEASLAGPPSSNPYWQTTASIPGISIFDNSNSPSAHSGSWKAWLGGNYYITETLSQSFNVPSSASSLQISYWWLVNTSNQSPSGSDMVSVQLLDNSGALLETPYHIYDTDQGSAWAQTIVTASQAYANQRIQINFAAQTTSAYITNFFIDDVSVTCQ